MRKKWSAPRLLSRRDFLRLTAAAAGTAAAGGMLSGCSEGGSENVRLMVWSPSQDQEIAQDKMPDMNCFTLEAAMRMVAGTARSMGINVVGEFPKM